MIGLNFDPSDLVWLMIDIEQAIEEFGFRFDHFQAKDVMIDYGGLYENGSLSSGIGWQIPAFRVWGTSLRVSLLGARPGRLRRLDHHRARGSRG